MSEKPYTEYGAYRIKLLLVDDHGEFEVRDALTYQKLRADREWRDIMLDRQRLGAAVKVREEGEDGEGGTGGLRPVL